VASTVYSVRFISDYAAPVSGTYVVPAGFRAIVRDVDAYNAPGGASEDYVFVGVLEIGGAFMYQHFGDAGWVGWRGRQVVNEGETIQVGGNTESVQSIQVSGYLLTLP
jgi:hypothetical protein